MAEHHAPGPKQYILVFLFLLVMTGVTTGIAFVDLPGPLNPIVALLIAGMKAAAVILIFMHVATSSRLTKLVVTCGFFFLGVLLVLTSVDYISRPWSGPIVR